MYKMIILLITGNFLLNSELLSQHSQNIDITFSYPQKFRIGETYYSYNFRGIKSYMNDLRIIQPELYQQVYPTFSRLKQKRNWAAVTMVSTSVIGTALIISSMSNQFNNMSPDMNSGINVKFLGIGAGVGIAGIGALVAWAISPKEQDFLDFINTHNRCTKGSKMKIEIGFASNHQSFNTCIKLHF